MKKIILTIIILLGVFEKALFAQNIGINTANPYTTLDVKGNIFTSVHASNNLNDESEQVTRLIGHQSGNDIGGNAFAGMKIQVGPFGRNFRTKNNGSRISFQTWGNDISYSRDVMTINEFGNVGIGTVSPREKLEVVGNAKFSGNGSFGILRIGNVQEGLFQDTQNGAYRALQTAGEQGFSFQNYAGLSTSMFVGLNGTYAGRVGIGTIEPDAPLHIVSVSRITTPTLGRTLFGYNNNTLTTNVSATGDVVIHANGTVWTDGGVFVATSDKRIKNIIGQTNTANDLAILNKIQITDYKYKDQISNGSGLQKKVIAQQLQEVYPIAVNSNKGIIPNVFDKAKTVMVNGNVTIISTNKPHDFKTGDKVKLILEKTGEKIVEITVVNDTQFTVNEAINDNIFIYGKYVNDLLNVDYDAVAMLNVSATQELAKQVEALKKDNHNLRKENEELRKLVLNIQAKLEGNISANTK